MSTKCGAVQEKVRDSTEGCTQVNIKHVRSLHKFILEQYLRNIFALLEVCPYNIWIQNPLEWIYIRKFFQLLSNAIIGITLISLFISNKPNRKVFKKSTLPVLFSSVLIVLTYIYLLCGYSFMSYTGFLLSLKCYCDENILFLISLDMKTTSPK